MPYRWQDRLPKLVDRPVKDQPTGSPTIEGTEVEVPLSEEELRALEQLERALVEEDPKLASTLRGTRLRSSARRNAILAGVVFLIGIGVLMTGAVTRMTWLGILGFVIMLGAATVGVTAIRSRNRAIAADPIEHESGFTVIEGGRANRRPRTAPSDGSSFMDRMEERWRRRRDNGQM